MQVQVYTDNNIQTTDKLKQEVLDEVAGALGRFERRLTRVEVYLADTNKEKSGSDDKRCSLEARPKGLKPVAVQHNAETLAQAISGAVEKMQRLLDKNFERLDEKH